MMKKEHLLQHSIKYQNNEFYENDLNDIYAAMEAYAQEQLLNFANHLGEQECRDISSELKDYLKIPLNK